MRKYKVEIRQELQRIVEIEATSVDEALEKVNNLYQNGELLLNQNDLIAVEIQEADIELE